MPFPSVVNIDPAPGIVGDFCDATPRSSVNAGPGAYVAGPAGVTIGLFAWADETGTDTIVANTGVGTPTGFVHREQQALIAVYLQEASMVIPAGFALTLMNTGGFWVRNTGAAAVTKRMKAFANSTTGAVSFGAASATIAGAVETKWVAASNGAAGELVKMSSHLLG